MKKSCVAMLLVLVMTLACAAGFAEEPATKQENFIVSNENLIIDEEFTGKIAHIYAEIKNTGEEDLELTKETILLCDDNGEVVDTHSFMQMYPIVLPKGETGYLAAFKDLDDDNITSVKLNLKAEKSIYYDMTKYRVGDIEVVRLPIMNNLESDYIEAKVYNDLEDVAFDINVYFIIKEKATGKIVDVEEKDLNYSVGILPGTCVMVRQELRNIKNINMEDYEIIGLAYAVNFKPVQIP